MSTTTVINIPGDGTQKMRTTKFGNVTVTGPAPSEEQMARGVREGTRALDGLVRAFEKLPGITLPRQKDVPLFWADDDDPDIIIRELNGKIDRGRLVDGKYKAFD
jgi:hypothetical protein